MKPQVSIITCTARHGGIDVAWAGLKNQSFKDFEWIIMDEISRAEDIYNFCKDDRVRHFMSPPKKPGMFWNLDQSFNQALRSAEGALVITLQDYIYLPPDALEEILALYKTVSGQMGDALISTVGHKYNLNRKVKDLKGKISIYEEPVESIDLKDLSIYEKDPRAKGQGFNVCNPIQWEANFGLFPMSLAKEIGGFDEDFDAGWGYDNVNFAERAQEAGAFIWIDEENEIYSISHEFIFKEQDFKEEAPNNEDLWARKLKEINAGNWRLGWLSS